MHKDNISRHLGNTRQGTVSRRTAIALGAGALSAASIPGVASAFSLQDSSPPPEPADVPSYSSLAAAVQAEASRWEIPGLSAAVLHKGERTTAAAGVTSLEFPQPVTPDTRFQIGSISKVFTATAIMMLVDDGVLDLDAPVWEWVPDLAIQRPDAYATLTLRHLLNHTTGFEGDYFFDMGDGDDALEASIARFDEVYTWSTPGELVNYCNLGFSLAGRIIEIVTDQVFESAIADRIFDPLALDTAAFPSSDLATWPVASGHIQASPEDGFQVHRPWALPRSVNAAGGIACTADDLLTFAEMHMNGGTLNGTRVLSEDAVQEMQVRTSKTGFLEEGYGVGWNIAHSDGVSLIGHGGATNGSRAWLMTVPEHDFALAILTNSDEGLHAIEALETWALRHYLGIETAQRDVIDTAIEDLDAVTGRYENLNMIIDVWRVENHLHVEERMNDEAIADLGMSDVPVLANTTWPTGDNVFVNPAGVQLDTTFEFFEAPLFDDTATNDLAMQPVLRLGATRISRRIGDAPVDGPTQME